MLCYVDDYGDFRRIVESSEYLKKRIQEIAYDKAEFCIGLLRIRDFDSIDEYLKQVKEICKLFSDDLIDGAFENCWFDSEEILVDLDTHKVYKCAELK